MFWDNIASVYDAFETLYNKKVYTRTGQIVAQYICDSDTVLECACGTGAISVHIAPKCKKLIATDMSKKMLKEAEKKCKGYDNVSFKTADIMHLKCKDSSFDTVVAGNVIHLLDDPYGALDEFVRVCKPGGLIIIPTYINVSKKSSKAMQDMLKGIGLEFKSEFDLFSYKAFFEGAGFEEMTFELADGRMPCAITIIKNNKDTERN